MQITHHTQLLNALIEKYNLKSYLEIGVQNPANNFDKIKCKRKCGVDPSTEHDLVWKITSDDFFKMDTFVDYSSDKGSSKEYGHDYDLIFIDGLHHAGQVKRDFENSMKCLNDNGFIVLHDVLPENEAGTKVPRETRIWWGDVYKFAMTMHDYGYEFKTFNIDNGCMLVQKTPIIRPLHPSNVKYDWETFKIYKHILLRIVDEVVI